MLASKLVQRICTRTYIRIFQWSMVEEECSTTLHFFIFQIYVAKCCSSNVEYDQSLDKSNPDIGFDQT